MTRHKKVVLLSVPYCEPYPIVAPVLLAGCLEHAGITAQAFDFNIDFYHHFSSDSQWAEYRNFLSIGYLVRPKFNIRLYKNIFRFTKQYIKKIINNHDPEYIGLSIFTSESIDFGLVLSYIIRKHFPKLKIIAGGKGLEVTDGNNTYHYQKWIDLGVVDAVVKGDAETAIINLVKNNLTGVIIAAKQTKEDLDIIPLPKWEDYNFSSYSSVKEQLKQQDAYLTVTASKGCVRQCTFCDVASFWPDYIYRDPVKVANEIIFNYQSTGITKFYFTDNLINGSVSNFRTMNEILVSTIPNTIEYGGYAIFRGRNQMPEDDFYLAQKAGNYKWSVGVESGSEKVRFDMKKKFTNDDLDWSVNMLLKYGIQQNWLLIVGYPSETEEDFKATKDLLIKYNSFASDKKITIQITPTFMLLNNSPLLTNNQLSEEYGLAHLKNQDFLNAKFWTSKKYLDNDYPTRSRRWKELMSLTESLNYSFGPGMPVDKWREEITNLDKIYEQQKTKIFSIYQSK